MEIDYDLSFSYFGNGKIYVRQRENASIQYVFAFTHLIMLFCVIWFLLVIFGCLETSVHPGKQY